MGVFLLSLATLGVAWTGARADDEVHLGPLQVHALERYVPVGVMISDDLAWARLEGPRGTPHVASMGTLIGSDGGRVTAITTSYMEVTKRPDAAGELGEAPLRIPLPGTAPGSELGPGMVDLSLVGADVHGLIRLLRDHLREDNFAADGALEAPVEFEARSVPIREAMTEVLEQNELCVQRFESFWVIRSQGEDRPDCAAALGPQERGKPSEGARINLDFVRAHIQNAYAVFEHVDASVRYVLRKKLAGTVTIRCTDVTVAEAAATVAFALDLDHKRRGKTIRIRQLKGSWRTAPSGAAGHRPTDR